MTTAVELMPSVGAINVVRLVQVRDVYGFMSCGGGLQLEACRMSLENGSGLFEWYIMPSGH